MAYGTLKSDVVQSSTAGTPPQFNDGNGTQTGTLCRAWVNFNGTGTVAIRASFNVSSITDNGTGDYTINFATALSDANYSTIGMVDWATTAWITLNTSSAVPTTSAVRVQTRNSGTTLVDCAYTNVAIFR